VAARCKTWIVFAPSNAGIVGSIPTQGMDVCVYLFCVCVVLCVGSGLATGWSPAQGVLPTVYRIKKLKNSQVQQKDWRAIEWFSKACVKYRVCNYNLVIHNIGRLRKPSGLKHALSSLAWKLGSLVRIPLRAWMFSVCVRAFFCVCVQVEALRRTDHPPKEFYRLSKI
jgi:hypothetical protein